MIKTDQPLNGFVALNPLAGVVEYINTFELPDLEEMKSTGIVLMVEYRDGTRDFVEPQEIVEYMENITPHTIHFVQQEVFVPLMEAMLDMVEDMAQPPIATMSTNSTKQQTSLNRKFEKFKELTLDMLDRYKPNIEEVDNGSNPQ